MLFLGEARPDGIAAIGDAPEGIFDGQRVDGGRIVVAGPFFDVGVARVSRISDRFEQIVEARDAPDSPRAVRFVRRRYSADRRRPVGRRERCSR